MQPELEIPTGARRCVKSDLPLKAADHYFSLVREVRGVLQREDYAAEHWPGPPADDDQDVVAWWESRPTGEAGAGRAMAPNDVLLKLFDQWADDPAHAEARYVLTLLLVRRRVMRIEADERHGLFGGPQTEAPTPAPGLRVYCTRRDETYDVPEATPNAQRAAAIQQQLSSLLAA
ncbi:hypothetical protein Pla123a_39630 [Posidoniimonas polymericola]|uniref:Uncharacterized protein n=1 Tax=Posidoniimonas polymericola TaxID=2528002 RepID=A0A5C5YGR8_9BACT|nr:hypothetical protein [Posidoniimonas polymericola]TWT73625.1 hypothetical protein Pla123a_39630 [Posidoniimonas polymericola]